MSRDEFERRYAAMPSVKKAELIEGIVYMPSPVRARKHGRPHVVLATWLGYYISKTPGLEDFADNATVRLNDANEIQPDLMLLLPTHAGGQSKVDQEDYIEGAPELVCEISASTVSIDLHLKLEAYRRNGVREYLVWRTQEAAIDWFVLRDGKYETMEADPDGLLKSTIFPGLWLEPAAVVNSNLPRLIQVLDQGAATPEHSAFINRLVSAAG